MRLRVQRIPVDGPPLFVVVMQDAFISEVKREVQAQTGILVDQQQLFFDGELLDNDGTLGGYGIVGSGQPVQLQEIECQDPFVCHFVMLAPTATDVRMATAVRETTPMMRTNGMSW